MERNITNLVFDIQKLNRDILQEKQFTNELIKMYQYKSSTLRKLINRIVDNQKNYPSYINININEQKQINYAYNLLNQIDLYIHNTTYKQIKIYNKIPSSFKSFVFIISSIIIIYLYFKIFIYDKGGI